MSISIDDEIRFRGVEGVFIIDKVDWDKRQVWAHEKNRNNKAPKKAYPFTQILEVIKASGL